MSTTDETRTHTLRTPIDVEGKTVSSLTFHEPDVGEMIAAAKVGAGDPVVERMAQLAQMCGVPFPAFKRVKGRDLTAIMRLVEDWMGNDESGSTGTAPPS